MEKHEREALAAAVAQAASRFSTAQAQNIGEVNAILKQVGADLTKVVAALRA